MYSHPYGVCLNKNFNRKYIHVDEYDECWWLYILKHSQNSKEIYFIQIKCNKLLISKHTVKPH